ncbi:GTP cyclohydrolase II, partial [Staphylococcus epidermidis]|uniref:GTP cyclohydrolase II n=1 Tax=Staphylococcus epidermidis TaxID=1282 RepID=UPI0037DA0F65
MLPIVKPHLKTNPNLPIHSPSLTRDIFHTQRSHSHPQLQPSIKYIHQHPPIIIYLPQQPRPIRLINNFPAYHFIQKPYHTLTPNLPLRFHHHFTHYHLPPQILNYFHITQINFLTNNPKKFQALQHYAIH